MSFYHLLVLIILTPSLVFAGGLIRLPTCYIEDTRYKTIYRIDKEVSSKNFSLERSKGRLTDINFYDNESHHIFGDSDGREPDRIRRISKDIEKEEAPFEINGSKEKSFTVSIDNITKSGALESIVKNKKSKGLFIRLDRSLLEKEGQIEVPSKKSEKLYKISIDGESFKLEVRTVKNNRYLKWYCAAGFTMEACGVGCARFKPKFNSKMSKLIKKINFRTKAKNVKCRVVTSLFQSPNSKVYSKADLAETEVFMRYEITNTIGRKKGSPKDAAFNVFNMFERLGIGVKNIEVDCSRKNDT